VFLIYHKINENSVHNVDLKLQVEEGTQIFYMNNILFEIAGTQTTYM